MLTVEKKTGSREIKKPELFASNTLKIFAPKNLKFHLAEYTEYDAGFLLVHRKCKWITLFLDKQFIKIN